MEHQPSPGVNPPAWILGHLAICTDSALELMGQPKRLPEEWHSEFGMRSQPLSEKHPYPDKEELLLALREGHEAVLVALVHVTSEQLAAPNPLPSKLLQKSFPTVGDLLAHLLTTHEAAHLGASFQLAKTDRQIAPLLTRQSDFYAGLKAAPGYTNE